MNYEYFEYDDLFNLFKSDDKRWFKGNTHTHTTYSDGDKTPDEAVRIYSNAGYDFIFITDHLEKLKKPQHLSLFDDLSTDSMLVMPGLEMRVNLDSIYGYPSKRNLHIVALGLSKANDWHINWTPSELVNFILSEGAVPIIAHPYWSAASEEEMFELSGAVAIEVFNTTAQIANEKSAWAKDKVCNAGYSITHWDYMLHRKKMVYGLAADDAHWCWEVPDYTKAWIMLKSEKISLENILHALRNGCFYSTMGPEIKDIALNDGMISVITTPVKRISFITENSYHCIPNDDGCKTITEAKHMISECSNFLRIECVDGYGKYAWSNPMILE